MFIYSYNILPMHHFDKNVFNYCMYNAVLAEPACTANNKYVLFELSLTGLIKLNLWQNKHFINHLDKMEFSFYQRAIEEIWAIKNKTFNVFQEDNDYQIPINLMLRTKMYFRLCGVRIGIMVFYDPSITINLYNFTGFDNILNIFKPEGQFYLLPHIQFGAYPSILITYIMYGLIYWKKDDILKWIKEYMVINDTSNKYLSEANQKWINNTIGNVMEKSLQNAYKTILHA